MVISTNASEFPNHHPLQSVRPTFSMGIQHTLLPQTLTAPRCFHSFTIALMDYRITPRSPHQHLCPQSTRIRHLLRIKSLSMSLSSANSPTASNVSSSLSRTRIEVAIKCASRWRFMSAQYSKYPILTEKTTQCIRGVGIPCRCSSRHHRGTQGADSWRIETRPK